MNVEIEWSRPLPLNSLSEKHVTQVIQKLKKEPGLYIFGRVWGDNFEPLYIGQAISVSSRVKAQFNNFKLRQFVTNAKNGTKVLIVGYLVKDGRTNIEKALNIAERGFIQHFVAEGFDLHNTQGTKIKTHEVISRGRRVRPRGVLPDVLNVKG